MAPKTQSTASYNYNNTEPWPSATVGQIVYTAGQVQPKYFINNTNFPQGYVTPDDHWDNRWRGGVNSLLGWDIPQNPSGGGTGAKSLGQELESSAAFPPCPVSRVFKYGCLPAPSHPAD